MNYQATPHEDTNPSLKKLLVSSTPKTEKLLLKFSLKSLLRLIFRND